MSKLVRALVALALVTVLAGTRAEATPQPEDAASSYFRVDVQVHGTPPPGASIEVLAETGGDLDSHTVTLATANATTPDINDFEVGVIGRQLWVNPAHDGGATSIGYECTMTGTMGPPHAESDCVIEDTTTPPAGVEHVYATFWGKVNQRADVTIILTFGACDDQPGTVFLGQGDTPTAGPDVIIGTAGNDTTNGLGGNDVLCGRGGNDTLRGGEGRDRILGENGNDRLEGGAKGDTLLAGAGTDTILGQAGNDALDGGAQRDTCNGGTERDTGVRCEVSNGIP